MGLAFQKLSLIWQIVAQRFWLGQVRNCVMAGSQEGVQDGGKEVESEEAILSKVEQE